jgi:hypothetical protein
MCTSRNWSLPCRFSDKNFVCISDLCVLRRPPVSFLLIWSPYCMVKCTNYVALITQSFPFPCFFLTHKSRYDPQHVLSNIINVCCSLNVRDHILYIFIWKTHDSELNCVKHSCYLIRLVCIRVPKLQITMNLYRCTPRSQTRRVALWSDKLPSKNAASLTQY